MKDRDFKKFTSEEFENRFNKGGYYDSFIGWYGLNAGSPYRLNTL